MIISAKSSPKDKAQSLFIFQELQVKGGILAACGIENVIKFKTTCFFPSFFILREKKDGIEDVKKHEKFLFMQDVIWRTKETFSGHGR